MPSMGAKGTIIFGTVGRPFYGFDVFSVNIPSSSSNHSYSIKELSEHCLTDGVNINFNAQFVDDNETIVYISERTGSAKIYLTRSGNDKPEQLPAAVPESFFLDRPIVKNGKLFFVSAHEQPDQPFNSWCAVYSMRLDDGSTSRLTPYGAVDYSPAVSETGKLVAVASPGFRPWNAEFTEFDIDVVVFKESDPTKRKVICEGGGWPSWSGDSTLFFHRQAEDGWWSVFRVDIPEDIELASIPRRITPPGVHAFTPAASHDGKRIAIATRRPGREFRHIEIFDLEAESFHKITELVNPTFHHFNPFFSPESGFLGYHRFRGESSPGELSIPHLQPVRSPLKDLRVCRFYGCFPTFSANGDMIAYNMDFGANIGLDIVKTDGSKRWNVIKDRTAFGTTWNTAAKGKRVLYTSLGSTFHPNETTVHIVRISFDPTHLDDGETIPAEIKNLTKEGTGNNAFPACSPDGKHIVFRSGRSGQKNLYIMDATNGELEGEIRQLTDGPANDTMPMWSPDGKLIVFHSNRHNPDRPEGFGLYLIRPDGSDLRRVHVAGFDGKERETITHACFSPDSKRLCFTANIGGILAEPISMPNQFQPYGDIYVVRLDGTELHRLTWNAYGNGTPMWYEHENGNVDMDSLSFEANNVREKLIGQFNEPYWLTFGL